MKTNTTLSTTFLAAAIAGLAVMPAAGSDLGVTFELLVTSTFPTYLTQAPGDPSRIYYSTQAGVIRVIHNGTLLNEPFLDVTDLVGPTFASFTFHPDFQSNNRFYVIYQTDAYLSVLAQYTALTPDQADVASGQILLALPQSAPSHYMNLATFGPDGYMYVAKGDSGASTHGVLGQDLSTLHGKILRLDMNGGTPYDIPPDNPFVGIAGLDEIWAYGLRNPWRFSFDRLTGDLWIGDVGDATREEFSMQPAASSGGENYGWNCMEGVLCHLPADGCTCGEPSLVEPLYDYSHSVGCAMIGGYVYRGSAIPSLQGRYVFGDVCSGRVQAYEPSSGEVIDLFTVVGLLISFGEMLDGELYALSANQIVKLVFTDCNGNNTPDVQDISRGGSIDCNDNSVPDECESDCNGNGIADGCDIADGTSKDTNGNGIPDECDAASDINGDGVVSTADLLLLLGAWGPCGKRCPADLDGNGVVSTSDLLILLTNWG